VGQGGWVGRCPIVSRSIFFDSPYPHPWHHIVWRSQCRPKHSAVARVAPTGILPVFTPIFTPPLFSHPCLHTPLWSHLRRHVVWRSHSRPQHRSVASAASTGILLVYSYHCIQTPCSHTLLYAHLWRHVIWRADRRPQHRSVARVGHVPFLLAHPVPSRRPAPPRPRPTPAPAPAAQAPSGILCASSAPCRAASSHPAGPPAGIAPHRPERVVAMPPSGIVALPLPPSGIVMVGRGIPHW
jgi:hypothetical protein